MPVQHFLVCFPSGTQIVASLEAKPRLSGSRGSKSPKRPGGVFTERGGAMSGVTGTSHGEEARPVFMCQRFSTQPQVEDQDPSPSGGRTQRSLPEACQTYVTSDESSKC